MSLLSRALCLLLFLLPVVHSASNITNATELYAELAQMPQCAFQCATLLPATSCKLTDLNCLCGAGNPTNQTSAAQACVMEKCTVREMLKVQRVLQGICGIPVRDDRKTIFAVVTAFAVVATITCLIRLAIRVRSWGLLGVDDIFIFAAMASSFVLYAGGIMLLKAGLGVDLWGVQYNDIYQILFWFWVTELFYLSCVFLTKMSVLCFYLRVFTEPSFCWKAYALMGLCAAAFLSALFATVFQCTPVEGAWTLWDGQHTGHCINGRVVLYWNGASNIALDILILVLPLPTLWTLTLPLARKIGLLVVFTLGVFATIVTALRLQALINVSFNNLDFSYNFKPAAYWSMVEIYVGIICVCLPAIMPFFRAIKVACFGESRQTQYTNDSIRFPGRKHHTATSSGFTSSTKTKVGVLSRSDSTEELWEMQKA